MPDNGPSVNRGLLRPRDWAPLLELMHARATEPRFARPDRPAHTYAQTTRRTLAERLQHNAARSVAPDRAA